MLKLYNTLTRKKEEFRPIKDKEAGVYTCGPTVYNHAHIGNLRAYTAADILNRYLKYVGYKVKWVMNITDVDDKTIRDSKKEGIKLSEFTQKYEKLFFDDIEKINIEKKSFLANPKATDTIPEMQKIIKRLIKKDLAYIRDGSVYFSIRKYIASGHKYGELVNIDMEGFKDGARVDKDEYEKEDLKDFVLWKGKKEGEPGWDFEVNGQNLEGRPGWHIECSAMSEKYLGKTFDIHTGGIDLAFPHHEDEIAQSVGANEKPLANYFVHNEHLLVNGHKMSKSLNNFYTLEDVMKMIKNPLALRYLFLQAHYRSKLDFTEKSIKDAELALEGLSDLIRRLKGVKNETPNVSGVTSPVDVDKHIENARNNFNLAMDDDLNTPKAISALYGFAHEVGSEQDVRNYTKEEAQKVLVLLLEIDKVLGLQFDKIEIEKSSKEIQELMDQREKARKEKDFEKADKVRDKILEKGYELEDTSEGPRVKRIR